MPRSTREDTTPTSDEGAPAPPTRAQTPRGINHLVINVRDMEVSHKFWTEIMGPEALIDKTDNPVFA